MKLGLYIHIPFCRQKCLYCDFPSYANLEHLYHDYVAALCREISVRGGIFSDAVVDTVYIGGGTPTVLTAEMLVKIIGCINSSFKLGHNAEISIEANPGTVDTEKLRSLRFSGVNRISFGVQTFSDRLLPLVGRIHSSEDGVKAVRLAQSLGFTNVSVDLMYGLPGQSLHDLQDSLQQAVDLKVNHISVYGLKVEDGTPFAGEYEAGRLDVPSEEVDEAMYDYTVSFLLEHGYLRYEISNYAGYGCECLHNLKYWRYQQYLGLGAAAHSFIDGKRLANTTDVDRYIMCVQNGQSPVEYEETPDRDTAMAEFVFLALRTTDGLIINQFNEYFGQDFGGYYARVVENLNKQGLVQVADARIFLTPRGMKYGNKVFQSFLPDKP